MPCLYASDLPKDLPAAWRAIAALKAEHMRQALALEKRIKAELAANERADRAEARAGAAEAQVCLITSHLMSAFAGHAVFARTATSITGKADAVVKDLTTIKTAMFLLQEALQECDLRVRILEAKQKVLHAAIAEAWIGDWKRRKRLLADAAGAGELPRNYREILRALGKLDAVGMLTDPRFHAAIPTTRVGGGAGGSGSREASHTGAAAHAAGIGSMH